MGKSYRAYLPDQEFLLPPSLREWLPGNHLVYFVSDVVDSLKLSALDAEDGEGGRGQTSYEPRMMTKVLGCTGIAWGCSVRGASSGAWWRMWGFGCWRRATRRTSAPSRIFASCTWRRWPGCLKRC